MSSESSYTEEYCLSDIIESDSDDRSLHDDESDPDNINVPGPSQPIVIRSGRAGPKLGMSKMSCATPPLLFLNLSFRG